MQIDKGSKVGIEGKITNRSYTDKNGEKRYMTEIVVSDFLLMSWVKKGRRTEILGESIKGN